MKPLPSFHLWLSDGKSGPFTSRQILEMIQSGQCNPGTLATKAGEDNWCPLSTYTEIFPDREESRPVQPSNLARKKAVSPKAAMLLAALGFVLMLWFGLFFKTSRDVEKASVNHTPAAVNNIGLISDRESGMIFGAELFIGGCILLTGSRRD